MIGFNTCFPTSFVSKVPLKILMMMKITSINRGAGLCIQPRLMAMSVSTDKKVELTICIRKNEKEKRLPDELTEFLKNVKRKFDSSRIDMRGENVYYMPEGLPKLNGVRFLRSGLLLGELKKRRFEPSQALAMNLKKEEYENVLDFSVDDERIIKYLKGETLEVEDFVSSKEKGWYLVCVDGYPLGFGKLSGQMLKNKYLPGWRWQSS